jgi:diketogulonate reductase-like aldo/keto reductase
MSIYLPTSLTDCYTLSNGVKIPAIGYGTWQTPNDVTADLVKTAIDLGYRHVDTAWGYANEIGVGDGIRASGVKREDIFVTTKHWVTFRGYQKTIEAVDESLKNLGLDYIDLYLVHWPCVELSNPAWAEINADTWRGFEAMYKAGKLRSIGVSNYEEKQIEALAKTAEIMPMVNQLEFHPGYMQLDNIRYNQQKGILVEAWSPLGSGAVLKDETLAKIAAKYNKSVAQLCIRLSLDYGILPLPKSTNAERITQNADVFDFEISAEDRAAIEAMPKLGYSGFTPEEAPADKLAGLC